MYKHLMCIAKLKYNINIDKANIKHAFSFRQLLVNTVFSIFLPLFLAIYKEGIPSILPI